MTPTQLRAFVAVVRLGSVKGAAADLEVSEAAVSLHVGQLRKELGDKLFLRTGAGLAFTPGGLRLASRAADGLGSLSLTLSRSEHHFNDPLKQHAVAQAERLSLLSQTIYRDRRCSRFRLLQTMNARRT